MYRTDAGSIASWIYSDPGPRFRRLVLMVSLSIQQPFADVGKQLADVDANGGKSKYLWGIKGRTWEWLEKQTDKNIVDLYDRVSAAVENAYVDTAHLLLNEIPGIGVVKGGFILQCAFGVSGCIDSVNVKRLGINPNLVRSRKKLSPEAQTRRVRGYLALIERCGGTARLWDDWCVAIAERDARFQGAEDVSRRHYTYLTGDWKEEDLPL